jgi:hypothetical protein
MELRIHNGKATIGVETRLELFLVFLGFLLFVVVPSTTATQSDAIEVVMLSR